MDIAVLQLISSGILTSAGVVIAVVGLIIAYRQHHGYPPLLISTSHGIKGIRGGDIYTATLQFELWNRRRYPILIRHAELRFEGVKFESRLENYKYIEGWNIYQDRLYHRYVHSLDPGAHESFSIEAPFKKGNLRNLDELDFDVTIKVGFFDPLEKKDIVEIVHHRYSFHSDGIRDVTDLTVQRVGSEARRAGY